MGSSGLDAWSPERSKRYEGGVLNSTDGVSIVERKICGKYAESVADNWTHLTCFGRCMVREPGSRARDNLEMHFESVSVLLTMVLRT